MSRRILVRLAAAARLLLVLLPPLALALPLGARAAAAVQLPASTAGGGRSAVAADSLDVADSLAFSGDTAAALAILDRAVERRARDARAWHRRGMLLWGTVRSARRAGFMRDIRDIRRLDAADHSLRTAADLAPDSARYQLDLARFSLGSGLVTMRYAAQGMLGRAADAAKRAGDAALLAEALDEQGMVSWRRYESSANRALVSDASMIDSLRNFFGDPRGMQHFLDTYVQPFKAGDMPGESDYTEAIDLFRRAAQADSNYPRAVAHAFMALAERSRWEELRAAAKRRIGAAPWDPQPWLARGLAAHRLGDERDAAFAFDSALYFLTPEDRDRYTRLSRLLGPRGKGRGVFADSAAYAAASPEDRAEIDRVYWTVADPIALTPENEYRLEFLARVTYAELLWTSDDFARHGADTDRGDIHVRYGPPDVIRSFPPPPTVTTVWAYRSGLSFTFTQPPTWGTAVIAMDDRELADRQREQNPVSWANVPIARATETMLAQATRFRVFGGAGDSTDLVLFARIPMNAMTRGLDVEQAPVDVDFRVYDAAAHVVARDSSHEVVAVASPDTAARLRAWRRRLPPSAQLWRVEALAPNAMRAARAGGTIARDSARGGLAMSDVLVAERIVPRESATTTAPARWTDFTVAPSVGTFARGAPVALLWESYGLARDGAGASRYHVVVTLEKVKREGALAFAARVVGGAAQAVGLASKGGDGRVAFAFDRTAPASAALVDYLTLDVGDAPRGDWTLTVEVTDLVAKRTARATRTITLQR